MPFQKTKQNKNNLAPFLLMFLLTASRPSLSPYQRIYASAVRACACVCKRPLIALPLSE